MTTETIDQTAQAEQALTTVSQVRARLRTVYDEVARIPAQMDQALRRGDVAERIRLKRRREDRAEELRALLLQEKALICQEKERLYVSAQADVRTISESEAGTPGAGASLEHLDAEIRRLQAALEEAKAAWAREQGRRITLHNNVTRTGEALADAQRAQDEMFTHLSALDDEAVIARTASALGRATVTVEGHRLEMMR